MFVRFKYDCYHVFSGVHRGSRRGRDAPGIIRTMVSLAWGSNSMPRVCYVDGRLGPSAGVASMVTTSEGSVLRAVMRSMIHAETEALGKLEFHVEGELPVLGRLCCKTYFVPRRNDDAIRCKGFSARWRAHTREKTMCYVE